MSDRQQEAEQFRKVFIGGLSYKTTEDGLRGFYSQWGELLDCVVMTDKVTGKSRGFGFVTYSHSSMVDDAMQNRPHTIDGRTVQPKRAVPREESGNPGANVTVNKIFIGGIRDKPVTKEDLQAYFGAFGQILDCVIMVEKDSGKPRGFAFVEFDDYDPVDQVILKKYHEVNGVRIDVKKALPKESVEGSGGGGGRGGGGRGGGRGGRRGGGGGYGGGRDGDLDRGYTPRSHPYDNAGGGQRQGWQRGQQQHQWSHNTGWSQGGGGGGAALAPNYAGGAASNGLMSSSGMSGTDAVQPNYGYPSMNAYQQQPTQQGYAQDFGQNYGQSAGGGPVKREGATGYARAQSFGNYGR